MRKILMFTLVVVLLTTHVTIGSSQSPPIVLERTGIRLVIVPGSSPSQFTYHIEDFRSYPVRKGTGAVAVSAHTLLFTLREEKGLEWDLRIDATDSRRPTAFYSTNGRITRIDFDLTQVEALRSAISEARNLEEAGQPQRATEIVRHAAEAVVKPLNQYERVIKAWKSELISQALQLAEKEPQIAEQVRALRQVLRIASPLSSTTRTLSASTRTGSSSYRIISNGPAINLIQPVSWNTPIGTSTQYVDCVAGCARVIYDVTTDCLQTVPGGGEWVCYIFLAGGVVACVVVCPFLP